MDHDGDFNNDLASRRRLEFGPEKNISNHPQHEKNDEEQEDDFVDPHEKENKVNNHHLISKDKIPCIGQKFDSEDIAFEFYNEYALATGFSVRRSDAHRDSRRNIIDRLFVCSCEGHRKQDKRDVYVKSHRPETRTDCGARMKINSRHSDKYVVVEFVADHSGHKLVSPRKGHMLRSHRVIDTRKAAQLSDIDKAGIPPKAGLDYMAQQAGGRENVGFILEDVRNYIRSKRTMQMKEGDAGGVLNYLQLKQSEDPNFFYAVQIDIDDLITNVFWADGQMMADYIYFGDVVSFDTTYRKNNDGRPFALFSGVNHHKQTAVFGASLLYDETAETFMWLFDTFVKAMDGKKPITVLTDQDAAMAKALEEKWPETCHRLCIWHIYQNAARNLSTVFSKFQSFLSDFSSCIYDYEEEYDFLIAWQKMLDKYALQDNDWLQRLFGKKEKWALVYGRQQFCADLITTQRSESMHSVLLKYVSYKHNLIQFFHHFGRLIDDRRYEEMKADLRTDHSIPVLSLRVEILKHARTIYTHEVFKLFQEELCKSYDSKLEIISELDVISMYKVTPFEKEYHHTLTYDAAKEKISCSCKKFEFAGILCSHSLKVFSLHNIIRIPEAYIMKRWTKIAKKGIDGTYLQPSTSSITPPTNMKEENEKTRIGERYRDMCRLQNQLSVRASLSEERYESTRNNVISMIEEMDISSEKETTKATLSSNIVKGINSVSRMAERSHASKSVGGQVSEVSHNMDNTKEKAESTSNEVVVRGWKVKQNSKPKSGKRPKSGLEQATRRRKPKQNNKVELQNSTSGGHSSRLMHLVNTSSSLPSLSPQLSQVGLPSWSSTHPHLTLHNPNTASAFQFMPSSSQTMELTNPHVHQQLGYYTQDREMSQHESTSLTKLLQTQMLQRQDFGTFPINDSSTKPQQNNNEDEVGAAPPPT